MDQTKNNKNNNSNNQETKNITIIDEINDFFNIFVLANNELKRVKESFEVLDLDKLKLIFGEVNIKKEGLILKIFNLSYEEYLEVENYLSEKFNFFNGIEKRAVAELKAGLINAKNDNFIN